MNERQQKTFDQCIDALLSLPWLEREDVCGALRFNHIFCWECGHGSRENPNKNCQCSNDE